MRRTPPSTGLRSSCSAPTRAARELPWLGDERGRRLALRRGRARQSRAWSDRRSPASRAGSAPRCASTRRCCRRRASGERFETRTDALEVRQPLPGQRRGRRGGHGRRLVRRGGAARSRWSRTCSSPSRCRSSSTARSASAAAASTCARSRAATSILGGGRGWGDAELEPLAPADRRSRSRRWRTRLDRAGARRRARDPHLDRHRRQDARSHPGDRLLGDDARTSSTPSASPATASSSGPVVGEIIAELVTEGRSASPLAPFAIDSLRGCEPARGRSTVGHRAVNQREPAWPRRTSLI